jgi:hypothetical protein
MSLKTGKSFGCFGCFPKKDGHRGVFLVDKRNFQTAQHTGMFTASGVGFIEKIPG